MKPVKVEDNAITLTFTYTELCIVRNAIRRGISTLNDEGRANLWEALYEELEEVKPDE